MKQKRYGLRLNEKVSILLNPKAQVISLPQPQVLVLVKNSSVTHPPYKFFVYVSSKIFISKKIGIK